MIGEIDLSTKLRNGLHRVLPQSDRYVHLLERPHDRWNDQMKVFLETGSENSKSVKNFRETVLSTGFVEIVVEGLEHEGKKIREVGFEFRVERDGDRLNHVDNDYLQSRIRRRSPKVLDRVHNRSEVVPDVLLDHRDELSEILEVVFLQSDRASSHHRQESGQDLS